MKGVSVLILFFSLGACSQTQIITSPANHSLFVEALSTVQQKLEDKLQISFGGNAVGLQFAIFDESKALAMFQAGTNDAIYLHSKYQFCDPKQIVPPEDAFQESIFRFCSPGSLKRILAHELGHKYTAIIMRRYAPYGWMSNYLQGRALFFFEDKSSKSIASEGVAVYFQFAFERELRTPHPDSWFARKTTEDKDILKYHVGYSMVKPILDINIHHGVRCIVENSFTIPSKGEGYDFTALLRYREKMIECTKAYLERN